MKPTQSFRSSTAMKRTFGRSALVRMKDEGRRRKRKTESDFSVGWSWFRGRSRFLEDFVENEDLWEAETEAGSYQMV